MRASKLFILLVIFIFFVLKLVVGNDNFNFSVLSSDHLPIGIKLEQIFNEVSDQVGIPFGMRNALFDILKEKGFAETFKSFESESSPRDYGHGGGGGCSDSFAVFGFLAFLLALIDLLIRLGVIMATGRKRRSSMGDNFNNGICSEDPRAITMREGTLASYSLLRGFLNSMSTNDSSCSSRFFCEATREAAKLGKVGASFAKVASPNAMAWLKRISPETHDGVEVAGIQGIASADDLQMCSVLYPCEEIPKPYKFPAFFAKSSQFSDVENFNLKPKMINILTDFRNSCKNCEH